VALTLEEIIPALSSPDESSRCQAIENLQLIQDSKIILYLITALEDSSVRVREQAISALIKVGGQPVAKATASLLNSENVALRNAAVEILENLDESTLEVLESYINSSSVDVTKFALEAVGKILNKSPEPHLKIFNSLITRLSDDDPNVSGAAAEALGLAKDDLAIPHLLNHLSGPNQSYWLQCNIIVALSRIASPMALEALNQINKDQISEEAKDFLDEALKGEIS
jgi:HEAT repeat protein